ncbi:hypothetical protein ABZ816_39620 [Actinosynnema sp. NPDC047251]|uniref:Uncharacterized protein n=1 Tax=Saccharothrix espanaensis (strain ATCC 51144 / DSM 44229 / JCM 9112 / NBRC 15066 / NRRL 15764) TaxID=1179773 RepID=K0JZC6_SACES|nr:hypothetical protein [Saccharothrix espanaensis]CCH30617.1 hypothetical protein BN6_33130 [Saccharothrix espanaensis DSM 44229]
MLHSYTQGFCVDSDRQGNVYAKPCDSHNDHHQWQWWNEGDNTFMLISQGTWKCLAAKEGSSGSDGDVETVTCYNHENVRRPRTLWQVDTDRYSLRLRNTESEPGTFLAARPDQADGVGVGWFTRETGWNATPVPDPDRVTRTTG